MSRDLIRRLTRAEALFPPVTASWDLTSLSDDDLEILVALPREEAALHAHVSDPAYDQARLQAILDRLEPAR